MIKRKIELSSNRNKDMRSAGFLGRHTKLLTILSVTVFICLQVVITNLFSDNGSDLRTLEAQRQDLIRKNEQLRGELASLGSLSRIHQEAVKNLGMRTSIERLDFLVPQRLALQ